MIREMLARFDSLASWSERARVIETLADRLYANVDRTGREPLRTHATEAVRLIADDAARARVIGRLIDKHSAARALLPDLIQALPVLSPDERAGLAGAIARGQEYLAETWFDEWAPWYPWETAKQLVSSLGNDAIDLVRRIPELDLRVLLLMTIAWEFSDPVRDQLLAEAIELCQPSRHQAPDSDNLLVKLVCLSLPLHPLPVPAGLIAEAQASILANLRLSRPGEWEEDVFRAMIALPPTVGWLVDGGGEIARDRLDERALARALGWNREDASQWEWQVPGGGDDTDLEAYARDVALVANGQPDAVAIQVWRGRIGYALGHRDPDRDHILRLFACRIPPDLLDAVRACVVATIIESEQAPALAAIDEAKAVQATLTGILDWLPTLIDRCRVAAPMPHRWTSEALAAATSRLTAELRRLARADTPSALPRDLQQRLLATLGTIGEPWTVEPILWLLLAAERPERSAIAAALADRDDDAIVAGDPSDEALEEIVRRNPSNLQLRAATWLGRQHGLSTLDLLLKLLADARVDIQGAALAALGQLGDRRAVGPILDRLADPEARHGCGRSMRLVCCTTRVR